MKTYSLCCKGDPDRWVQGNLSRLICFPIKCYQVTTGNNWLHLHFWGMCSNEWMPRSAPLNTPEWWVVSRSRRSWTLGSWRWRCAVNSVKEKHAPPARSAGCICEIKTDIVAGKLKITPGCWWHFGAYVVLFPRACSRISSPLGFTVKIRHVGTPTCL